MVFIGIDPGGSGGVGILLPGEVRAFSMPATDRDILTLLEPFADPLCGAVACLERVWGMPGWGASNFKFGASLGALRMALTACCIPFEEVLPRRWQLEIGVSYAKGLTPIEKKNITKRRAQSLFPRFPITHAIADALLIAEFCRRVRGGVDGKEKGEWQAKGRIAFRKDAYAIVGASIERAAVASASGARKGPKRPAR